MAGVRAEEFSTGHPLTGLQGKWRRWTSAMCVQSACQELGAILTARFRSEPLEAVPSEVDVAQVMHGMPNSPSLVPVIRRPRGTGRGPGSHLCPASGCRRPVSPDRLMCRPHWYQVPKPLRDAVWATWRSGAGIGTREHIDMVMAAIAAASSDDRHLPSP